PEGRISSLCFASYFLHHSILWRPAEHSAMEDRGRLLADQMRKLELEFQTLKEPSRDVHDFEEVDQGFDVLAVTGSLLSRALLLFFLLLELFPEVYTVSDDDVFREDSDEVALVQSLIGNVKPTLPSTEALQNFYNKRTRSLVKQATSTLDILEPFIDALMNNMTAGQSNPVDFEIGSYLIIPAIFGKLPQFTFLVPLSPVHPYSFTTDCNFKGTCVQLNNPNVAVMMEQAGIKDICKCSDCKEDTLCLLSRTDPKSKLIPTTHWPGKTRFCKPDSTNLEHSKVLQWFLTTVSQSCRKIAASYQLEIVLRDHASPCAFKAYNQSGNTMKFDLVPAICCTYSDVYVVPASYADMGSSAEALDWGLVFAVARERRLSVLAAQLPSGKRFLQALQLLNALIELNKMQTTLKLLRPKAGLRHVHLQTVLLHHFLELSVASDHEHKASDIQHCLQDLLSALSFCLASRYLPLNVAGITKGLLEGQGPNMFGRTFIPDDAFQQMRSLFQENKMEREKHQQQSRSESEIKGRGRRTRE
uniref:Inositol 1,4,5-trisphosphate receptor-interacting protein n=1 Tax=Eptatretus burgeri TaxID=7764 RepID=A0A8C4WXT2_EPTBU